MLTRDRHGSTAVLQRAVLRMAALALLAHAGAASAQQLYKCGSTFSQTPCAADAVAKPIQPALAPDAAPGAHGYALCAASARKLVVSPEPESMRIQPVGARRSEVIRYAGQSIATHRYDLTVDARTSAGVFSGPQGYACWLSEDQARMLQFTAARP